MPNPFNAMHSNTCTHLIALLAFSTFLLSCRSTRFKQRENVLHHHLAYDRAQVATYFALLDSLNSNQYVPYFRSLQNTGFEPENWHMNADENQYLLDSISFAKAHAVFFNQDRAFLHWLLHFKYDTLRVSSPTKRTLWSEFVHPYSSSSPNCIRASSPSKQALNLLYGLLNRSPIECRTCRSCNAQSDLEKYAYIEVFLTAHPKASLTALRQLWVPY